MSRVSITSDKFVFNNVKLVEQIIVLELIVQYRDSHRFEEFKKLVSSLGLEVELEWIPSFTILKNNDMTTYQVMKTDKSLDYFPCYRYFIVSVWVLAALVASPFLFYRKVVEIRVSSYYHQRLLNLIYTSYNNQSNTRCFDMLGTHVLICIFVYITIFDMNLR